MLLWNRGEKGGEKTESGVATPHAATPGAPRAAVPSTPSPAPQSLPELLLSEGKISEEQLRRAQERQRETGEFIGEILIRDGAMEENTLISFIAKHCKIPHLSLLDYLIDEACLGLIPREVCLKHRLLPIDKLGKNLTVAMVNPLDREAMEAVREHCPDLRIKPILCAFQHFETVTARVFQGAGKGPVEMSMSTFGLKRIPGLKTATPAPPPQPAPPEPVAVPAPPAADVKQDLLPDEQQIPMAVPVDVLPATQDDMLRSVFQQSAETAEPAPAAPKERSPEGNSMMREMATVMLNSMRDTYAMLSRRLELFRGIDPEEVARIFARSVTMEVEPGELIFQRGESADKMYAILGGEVEIERDQRLLAKLSRGDMFGEMALLSREPRSATARALSSVSLLALDRETLQTAMSREVSTQLLINIIITLSNRLRVENERGTNT